MRSMPALAYGSLVVAFTLPPVMGLMLAIQQPGETAQLVAGLVLWIVGALN
jgi:hypothetical protein